MDDGNPANPKENTHSEHKDSEEEQRTQGNEGNDEEEEEDIDIDIHLQSQGQSQGEPMAALGATEMKDTAAAQEEGIPDIDEVELMPRPPKTGYMLFRKYNIEKVRNKSVSEQSKIISNLWNVLTKEEKSKYNDECVELKGKYKEWVENNPQLSHLIERSGKYRNGKSGGANGILQYPLARVKKLIEMDSDIKDKRVAKEATILITRAAELFTKKIAKSATELVTSQGKKTLMEQHLFETIHAQRSYLFLRHCYPRPSNSNKHGPNRRGRNKTGATNRRRNNNAGNNSKGAKKNGKAASSSASSNGNSQGSITNFFSNQNIANKAKPMPTHNTGDKENNDVNVIQNSNNGNNATMDDSLGNPGNQQANNDVDMGLSLSSQPM